MRATTSAPDTRIATTSSRTTTQESTTSGQRKPEMSSSQPGTHDTPYGSGHIREALKTLTDGIKDLTEHPHPDASEVLSVCEWLKYHEDELKQAPQDGKVANELDQLRNQLPKLFTLIDRCILTYGETMAQAPALQTLCMGLSTLASPLSGPLLTRTQCSAAQARLTSISNTLAQHLSIEFNHGIADTGLLLNCLNWFSRALKADLLKPNQPAVSELFQNALEQIHLWSDGKHVANLNSRQLAKAMVQLNTMIKQNLIKLDQVGDSKKTNQETWSACVQNLSRRFLSSDEWLRDCVIVELINVTNTLKDGLDLRLLDGGSPALQAALPRIAHRMQQQTFGIPGTNLVNLSNCANFLRCLFEHDLLGGLHSETGSAAMHLVRETAQLNLKQDVPGTSTQSLANLASYLKAADRWLARQSASVTQQPFTALAGATDVLIAMLDAHIAKKPHGMQSPANSSALLSALQHLRQRGLVPYEQRARLQNILTGLLENIPSWQTRGLQSQTILQTLRTLTALARDIAPMPALSQLQSIQRALTTLLGQLQQSLPAQFSNEERLACLQAVQTGDQLGALAIDEFQPLLRGLLKTTDPIDLARLAQAIHDARLVAEPVDALTLPALNLTTTTTKTTSTTTTNTNTTAPQSKAKPRSESYQGEIQPPKPSPVFTPPPKPSPAFTLPPPYPLPRSKDEWIAPRNTVKRNPLLITTATPALPLFEPGTSTAPQLASRPSAKNKADTHEPKTRKTTVMPEKTQAASRPQEPVQSSTPGRLRLPEAQQEWFNLLSNETDKALPRLKTLATQYPQLLNQKRTGKQGQIPLFYALTQGNKKITEWLISHEQHKFDANLGDFLLDVLKSLGPLEKNQIAAIRLLITSHLQKHDEAAKNEHQQLMPDVPPLTRKGVLERRKLVFTEQQKHALGQFTLLHPLFEEFKLIEPEILRPTKKPALPARVGNIGQRTVHAARSNAEKLLREIEEYEARKNDAPLISSSELASLTRRSITSDTSPAAAAAINQIWSKYLRPFVVGGRADLVRELLATIPTPDAIAQLKNEQGKTVLLMAAELNHADVVMEILKVVKDKNALAGIRDSNGMTALLHAVNNDNIELVFSILNIAHNKDELRELPLNQQIILLSNALENRRNYAVTALLQAADDPDTLARLWDEPMISALALTADRGLADITDLILREISDPDALVQLRDTDNLTPLMRAAVGGHADIIISLLSAVNDKNTLVFLQDPDQRTALHLAAMNGCTEGVQRLLHDVTEKDALAQLRDRQGMTALHSAAIYDDAESTTAILKAVKDKDALALIKDENGLTALTWAAMHNQIDVVASILNHVNDIDTLVQQQDINGMSVLMYAAEKNLADLASMILSRVNNKQKTLFLQNTEGLSAFSWTAVKGQLEVGLALLNSGVDKQALITQPLPLGMTPLMIAAARGSTDLLIAMLDACTNKDEVAMMQCESSRTALMWAVIKGHYDAAYALLNAVTDKRALVLFQNAEGETALQAAIEQGDSDIASLLEEVLLKT